MKNKAIAILSVALIISIYGWVSNYIGFQSEIKTTATISEEDFNNFSNLSVCKATLEGIQDEAALGLDFLGWNDRELVGEQFSSIQSRANNYLMK